MSPYVSVKVTVVVLVLAVLADSTDVIPPEYRFKRYVYRKKTRSVSILICFCYSSNIAQFEHGVFFVMTIISEVSWWFP